MMSHEPTKDIKYQECVREPVGSDVDLPPVSDRPTSDNPLNLVRPKDDEKYMKALGKNAQSSFFETHKNLRETLLNCPMRVTLKLKRNC